MAKNVNIKRNLGFYRIVLRCHSFLEMGAFGSKCNKNLKSVIGVIVNSTPYVYVHMLCLWNTNQGFWIYDFRLCIFDRRTRDFMTSFRKEKNERSMSIQLPITRNCWCRKSMAILLLDPICNSLQSEANLIATDQPTSDGRHPWDPTTTGTSMSFHDWPNFCKNKC